MHWLAIVLVLTPVILLCAHCILANRIGRNRSFFSILAGLLGLTVVTTLTWVGSSYAAAYFVFQTREPKQQTLLDVFDKTLSLPFYLFPQAPILQSFLGLPPMNVASVLLLPSVLLILGLVFATIRVPRRIARVQA
jgi:hypothetical protein